MTVQSYPIRVASDTLLRKGDQLIVCSKADMNEWQIQQTRKTIIRIEGEDWCLVGRHSTPAKEIRYQLEPWVDFAKEIPGRRIVYDENYVRARDEAAQSARLDFWVNPILCHARLLIGFLPSTVKARIERRFGIPARSATFISLIAELLVFFLLGALLQVFVYGAMHAPSLVVFIPTLVIPVPLLFLDLIIRYGSYLREDPNPLGVLEWIVRWKSIWRSS